MRAQPALVALAIGLTACSAGTTNDSDEAELADAATTAPSLAAATSTTAAASVPSSTRPASEPAPTTAPETTGGGSTCLDGTWSLASVSGATGPNDVALDGEVSGMTVTFDGDSWELTADDASLAGDVEGIDVTLSLDGSASGELVAVGDELGLQLTTSDGEAVVENLGTSLPFEVVVQSLVPTGLASSSCDDTSALLTSTTATLTLARTGEIAGPVTSPPDGAAIVIESPATEVTQACDGRSVEITASASSIMLTGDCPSLTVAGSTNSVRVERVGAIVLTGDFNSITWSSALTGTTPTITDTGTINRVSQG